MKKTSRILAMLMAALMVVGMFGVTASAQEAEDPYVLNYNGVYDGPKWQYFSPYIPAWRYDGSSDYNNTIAFTLYDTANGEGFATYCTDAAVGLDNNSSFRRINLEDSTYAGSAAGLLRSVFLSGYPNTGLEELAAAAGLETLTVGEAVTATQLAIWSTAHGELMEVTDFCRSFDTQWSPDGVTAYYDECYAEIESGYASAENETLIEANIEKVYQYLMNLSPTAPSGEVASYRSFKAWDSELVDNEDGTYDVVATATVDVAMNEGDALTLTALVGDYTASAALEDGEHSYTLTIENVPAGAAVGTVTLTIDGVQSLRDVYLFDAEGGRGESQSLIGITGNALPVYAEVNANDRVLIVNKTDDGVGLQNITFDIYHVCSVEDYLTHEVTLGTGVYEVNGVTYFSSPTQEDIAKYVTGFPFATITTDANGQASFNFGNENDGIYIVVERENAVTTGAINPFFVAIPGGSCACDTDVYEILVQPKNDVIEEDVEIEKDVNEIDRDQDTHDVGEIHTWIIQSSIPAGMATGLKYEITDTLSYQLTYVGNVVVTVSEKAAAAHEDLVELAEGEDYILTVTPGTDDCGKEITSFKVALTRSGMEKVAAVEGTEPEVRVYFDAFIDEDAVLGSLIPNQAHISYENNVGVDFDMNSDVPEVYTCGISLVKVDASNGRKLAGAKFTLNVKNEDGSFTPVEFCTDAALTQKACEVTTGDDGIALIYGVKAGTYYLIETEAPEGYNKLTDPVEVELNRVTHQEGNVLTVKNSALFQLPETGGIGTALFTFGGAGIIGAAALVLLGGKKKRN